jgi:FMN phosphatase YigB (HAD superfamily)
MTVDCLGKVKAVLFDLDGTLLQVEMNAFIPAYIDKLAVHFADVAERRAFTRVVRAATFALIQSDDGETTNEELFHAAIERQLGIDGRLFGQRLERFYDDGMADLEGLIRPLPLARNILARCFERGLKVVIATNPVFPRAVVEARLRWGGLADFPFELVTTFENSRYCKPNPRYFHDVLDHLGLVPEEVVMVGNDTEHDLGARDAGIATFLVDTWLVDRLDGAYRADIRGGHMDLFRFVGRLGGSE